MKTKISIVFVLMISMAGSSFTSLLGWQGTVLVYNAYFQAFVAVMCFTWLTHKAYSSYESKVTKPITNARDSKK